MNKKPLIIIVIHWACVLLFTVAILSGYRQVDANWSGAGLLDRTLVNTLHETSGILIAILVALWGIIRAFEFSRKNKAISVSGWFQYLIVIYHLAFSLLGGTIAFLGWAGSSAGNYGQALFGFIPVPNIIPVLSVHESILLYSIHKELIPYFLAMVVFHIIAVLYHVVVLKDELFQKMWFSRR